MTKQNLLMTAIALLGLATVTKAQQQLSWGTYYTGTGQVWPNGEDRGNSCITDASGNVYMGIPPLKHVLNAMIFAFDCAHEKRTYVA